MAMRCAPSEPRSRARSSPWTKPCRRPSRPCWRCWMPCPTTAPSGSSIPPQRRQRTLEALRRVLLRESQVQPLLLVCEDLHWIDSETQALLDRLSESLPTAPILLLVNYRPECQHGWGSKTYYTQLRLDPLLPVSADELLHALLGDDPSLTPLKHLLIARTEGNPFFLEESVRTLVETCVLGGERSMPVSSRPSRRSPGTGWLSRPNAWPTMPCAARCGTRLWRIASRPGKRPWRGQPIARPWGASSRRSVSSRICRRHAT